MAVPVVLDARVVTGSGGGPDKTILNSPRFLSSLGYQVLCAYMHPPRDPGFERLRDKARACDAILLSVPDRGPFDPRVASHLLEICRRYRVSIWHGHDYKSNLVGLILRQFWPMRLVTTVHGWVKFMPPRMLLYYAMDRLSLPHYEKVICVSEDLHQACLACGVAPQRCLLIENAVDTQEYARTMETGAAKQRLGLPPGRVVIGAVGRLSAEKGFDLLIRAVDRLLKMGFDVELLVVGEGNQRPQLERLISDLGRTDRIRLMGYRSDTINIYHAMDIFALSSYYEGLPNVLLEAMALEIPVVATRVAGIPRLIRHEGNGLLVEPGSTEALSQALTALVKDVGFRTTLGYTGRQTVEAGYSFDVRMRKIRAIYDDLLNRN